MWVKRLLTAVLAACAALVVIEAVLQALAVTVWLSRRSVRKSDDGTATVQTVLCLGDSYTFGMGASEPARSYPSRLENKLRNRLGDDWRVLNGGWPSRNSREVIEAFDASVAEHRPRYVCLVVGLNDRWSRPDELLLPTLEGTPLIPESGRFPMRCRTWRLLTIALSGKPVEAADGPFVHLDRLRAKLADGNVEGATQELEWLREAQRQQPSRWAAEALCGGLKASGREDEALTLARHQVALYPDSSNLWLMIAQQSARIGDMDAARQAIDSAIENASNEPGSRSFLLRTRASVYRGHDPGIVAESLILACIDGGDEAQGRQWFQVHRQVLSEELLTERCADLGLSASERSEVLETYRQAVAGEGLDETSRVLGSHLRQVVVRCRHWGVEPLFGSYPWSGAFGEEIARSVAAELGVAWVSVAEVFAENRRADPEAQLFVHDGHCNDAGYDLMAEAFAREIVRLTAD